MVKFEQLFLEQNPNYIFLLERLRRAIGKDCIEYKDITTVNLRRFKDFMESEVTANSMRTYFAVLKAFINGCVNDGLIASDKCLSALKVKATPQQNVALTESEVESLYKYYVRIYARKNHQAEKDVLTLFLIECYCGARGVDVEKLTLDNISNGMLSYVSQKTKVLAVIPAHKSLPMLLSRMPDKQYTRQTKNRIIKNACKRCGIIEPVTLFHRGAMRTLPKYELTSTHCARRSFASILAAKGVPVVEIAQYMGHENTLTTNRYIVVDTHNTSEAAMSFFNN